MDKKSILHGIRVLDASTVMAGPLMSNLLGDFGAEVIRIEQPGTGDIMRHSEGSSWKVSNRNKKCITLDFHKPEARELFYGLVEKSDIVILNFRPQALGKWKIDYEDLVKVKENIILMHFTAFGRTGPYCQRPGFARVAEGFSGLMHITGFPDRKPVPSGYPIMDAFGGVYGAFSLMLALYHLKETGEGQLIDLSLYDPILRTMEDYIVDFDLHKLIKERIGTHNPYVAPNDLYETLDKRWLILPASNENIYKRLLKAVGLEELLIDPRFLTNSDRVRHRTELDEYLIKFFAGHKFAELKKLLEENDVAYGWVNSVQELVNDPHVQAREDLISVFDPELKVNIKMQSVVPRMSKTPGEVKWVGPALGAHNREIYQNILGLSEAELSELMQKGII